MRAFLILIIILCWAEILRGQDSQSIQLQRWDQAEIQPHRANQAARICQRILANKHRYVAVDKATDVPWYVIAALHNMESYGSFKHHLHEGSPLTGRTRWVPKGRPKVGKPPFMWEVSAVDALQYDNLGRVKWWDRSETLYACERYNGTGYLRYHPETPSPYLWAGTTIERSGKYIADGKWSPTARSSQIGVATLFKAFESNRILNFSLLTP